MTIEFVLDISRNDGLVCDFEGMDELDLRVEVDPFFEDRELSDLEITGVDIYTSEGWRPLSECHEEEVFTLLYYSDSFAQAIIEQAEEEAAENDLDRRIQAAEARSDELGEARCWSGMECN